MTPPLPILIRPDEALDIKSAAEHSRRSTKTIRRWIKGHAIGCQPLDGGRWSVSLLALEMVAHGDLAALELLRAGQRSAPEVRRYLEFLGLPQ